MEEVPLLPRHTPPDDPALAKVKADIEYFFDTHPEARREVWKGLNKQQKGKNMAQPPKGNPQPKPSQPGPNKPKK